MSSLEDLKEQIREEAGENPDKFFATSVLREEGFERKKCRETGTYFWTTDPDREVCGEPELNNGYSFINNSPTEKSFSHIESWKVFEKHMKGRGYKSVPRYPVVARWRDDEEFVGASIYNFQPHVVSGEAEPPSPELIVPQPCLRFNDIDNVGITGRHYCNFTMIGQACFQPPEKYDQDRYFRDMYDFVVEELGIPKDKLVLHEDAWGGGGNLGASMEFFVDGLELFNQVYMFYKQTPDGYKELDQKVLDMGMGHERITWISRGTETSYESVMPETVEKLKQETGLKVDKSIWRKFLPHSSILNIDEVEDIDKTWEEVANRMDIELQELKNEIKPAAALYSIAEHTRALCFGLADGKLPSNTGGGHNLRMIYRRAMDFIKKYEWSIELTEVAEWHINELKPMYPELEEKLPEIQEILEIEKKKYRESRQNALKELKKLEEQPSLQQMVKLYESHGVSPEMMEEQGFKVPEDFYTQIASKTQKTKTETLQKQKISSLEKIPSTELVYYQNQEQKQVEAEIKAVENNWIVFDKTVFYPEGGGQAADTGTITTQNQEYQVTDVQKQDNKVLHKVENPENLEKGVKALLTINYSRRYQLMQHHTATHLLNGVTKQELGNHVWQAGASKKPGKARLDITHYEKLDRKQLDQLEKKVKQETSKNHKVEIKEMEKTRAEQKHGFRIYQGGAPPGNKVRIVKIGSLDVEACGGTHLPKTSEIEDFIITNSNKVQDGVIRIEYKAGSQAIKHRKQIKERINRVADKLNVQTVENPREAQRKLCKIYSVKPSHLEKTLENFLEDIEILGHKITKLSNYLNQDTQPEKKTGAELIEKAENIFQTRKEREKQLEKLEKTLEQHIGSQMENRVIEEKIPTENIGLLIQITRKLAKDYQASVTLIGEKGGVSASYHEEIDADKKLEEYGDNIQGDNSFAKTFNLN